jgi:hypothetical protein
MDRVSGLGMRCLRSYLFGTLLPEIGKSVGLDQAGQASLATWVAVGTVVVALCVGPVVDRFGADSE